MLIHSHNEWDSLREVVVGRADNANWPLNDPVWAQEAQRTQWKETPIPQGPVSQNIIDETNEDLEGLCDILRRYNVTVHRPASLNWQELDGFSVLNIRDRLLVAGEVIVDTAMMYPCRDREIQALNNITEGNTVLRMPRGKELVMDAANVCRLGDSWLYLESRGGSRAAGEWLGERFPNINIYGCSAEGAVHINNVLVPLREGLILVNAERIKSDAFLPKILEKWEKVWISDLVAQDFDQYPCASKWVGMNLFSINPETVIVEASQIDLINRIEQYGITVIPHPMRHARTLGCGLHSVTLDVCRKNT